MSTYQETLIQRFWQYRKNYFTDDVFDRPFDPQSTRLPVFTTTTASNNILMNPNLSQNVKQQILEQIPLGQRHKWFRSMSSSQAIAQSVFGNLIALSRLDCLANLVGDDGRPLFVRQPNPKCIMEYTVNYLGEPRPTNIDAFFAGNHRIAVECKLTEAEVGTCSRPRLTPKESNYEADFCNGNYEVQGLRKGRCSLTARGIKYWTYIPKLFKWSYDSDFKPCPFRDTYQLVRNILAACVSPDGELNHESGHAVLLYDARNPAFQPKGDGYNAWQTVKTALIYPHLLQQCTWQEIIEAIKTDPELIWLTQRLQEKYGL